MFGQNPCSITGEYNGTFHHIFQFADIARPTIRQQFIQGQAPPATAQSGGGYDLTWNTLDGGGGTSTGGAYSLTGTIGQADAGAQSGGSYTVGGGFWAAFTEALYRLFVPIVTK